MKRRKINKKRSTTSLQRIDCHLRKTAHPYLFQLEDESSKLHVLEIPKNQIETHSQNFTISRGMGFFHVDNCFYLGGGTLNWSSYFSNFRKVMPNGQYSKLQSMPTPKAYFPMTLWRQKNNLLLHSEEGMDLD